MSNSEIETFLKQAGFNDDVVIEYVEILDSEEVTTVKDLALLSEADLKDMGIAKTGHVRKMLRKAKEAAAEQEHPIIEFLEVNNMSEYKTQFIENEILTPDDLKDFDIDDYGLVGVTKKAHIKKLMRLVTDETPVVDSSAAAAPPQGKKKQPSSSPIHKMKNKLATTSAAATTQRQRGNDADDEDNADGNVDDVAGVDDDGAVESMLIDIDNDDDGDSADSGGKDTASHLVFFRMKQPWYYYIIVIATIMFKAMTNLPSIVGEFMTFIDPMSPTREYIALKALSQTARIGGRQMAFGAGVKEWYKRWLVKAVKNFFTLGFYTKCCTKKGALLHFLDSRLKWADEPDHDGDDAHVKQLREKAPPKAGSADDTTRFLYFRAKVPFVHRLGFFVGCTVSFGLLYPRLKVWKTRAYVKQYRFDTFRLRLEKSAQGGEYFKLWLRSLCGMCGGKMKTYFDDNISVLYQPYAYDDEGNKIDQGDPVVIRPAPAALEKKMTLKDMPCKENRKAVEQFQADQKAYRGLGIAKAQQKAAKKAAKAAKGNKVSPAPVEE